MKNCAKVIYLSVLFILFLIVHNSEAQIIEIDTVAHFPHWELDKDVKTTTSFYVSNVGIETDSISVKIYFENGSLFTHQLIHLYVATNTPALMSTGVSGSVSFALKYRQSARIDLRYEKLGENLFFGYAEIKIFWISSGGNNY